MIRPFDLSDTFHLYRLSSHALCFDTRLLSTQRIRPVRRALLGRMFPAIQPETHIACVNNEILGFAQCAHRTGHPLAQLIMLSPDRMLSTSLATDALEALITVIGSRQAHYLLAESETQSDSFGFLRRSGFAVYARQTIWRGTEAPKIQESMPSGSLRPTQPQDQPAITGLFSSIVPAMVQQVEKQPDIQKSWSLLESGELVGFFQCVFGPLGVWVDPYFHPSAHQVSEWLTQFNYALLRTYRLPVFYCVRSYQEWLGPMLQGMGFACCLDQSVLARRIVAPTMSAQPVQLTVVEGNAPPVTTMTPPASSAP
jgi:hypothetical protein